MVVLKVLTVNYSMCQISLGTTTPKMKTQFKLHPLLQHSFLRLLTTFLLVYPPLKSSLAHVALIGSHTHPLGLLTPTMLLFPANGPSVAKMLATTDVLAWILSIMSRIQMETPMHHRKMLS